MGFRGRSQSQSSHTKTTPNAASGVQTTEQPCDQFWTQGCFGVWYGVPCQFPPE
jgi:hypothetical protein